MMEAENNRKAETNSEAFVARIASGQQASLSDEPLTPQKKMQAEQMRMKDAKPEQEPRHESDRQQANLGNSILTPQRKMNQARAEAKPRH